jgi:hypothetical protein
MLEDPEAIRRKKARWEPTRRDELEAALSVAAMDTGLDIPEAAWCEFVGRAGNILCGNAAAPRPAPQGM